MTTETMTAPPRQAESFGSRSTRVKHFVGDYGILLIFAGCLIFLSIAASNFLTADIPRSL